MSSQFSALCAANCELIRWLALQRPMTSRTEDPDAQVATELAELEALAATLPEDEVEGVPPVAGPQDWE